MSEEEIRQSIVDEEHLKLLSIGYYISAGVCIFFSMFGLLYMFLGLMMGTAFNKMGGASSKLGSAPPPEIGWIFGIIGLVLFLMMITMALLKFRTARCIKRRRSRIFCMVVAGISCFEIPYGTTLGVFTSIVLGRNSVKALFEFSEAT